MRKWIVALGMAVLLTGCAVSYTAHPTDEKRQPNCVQLQRREGNNYQNLP